MPTLGFMQNKTGTGQFQDRCKNWTLNPGFCYYGRKKEYIQKILKFKSCVEKTKEKRKKVKKVVGQLQARPF